MDDNAAPREGERTGVEQLEDAIKQAHRIWAYHQSGYTVEREQVQAVADTLGVSLHHLAETEFVAYHLHIGFVAAARRDQRERDKKLLEGAMVNLCHQRIAGDVNDDELEVALKALGAVLSVIRSQPDGPSEDGDPGA